MPPRKSAKKEAANESAASLARVWKCYTEGFEERVLPLLGAHAHMLTNLVRTWDACVPNILFYGASGMPFFPMWSYLVLRPLGRCLKDVAPRAAVFTHNGASLPYTETDAYIYINFHHPDTPRHSDGAVLLEFLKVILRSRCLHLHKHVVILDNIDAIQICVRDLLERYSSNVWFVATTTRFAAIEPPVVSRFLCVRVPLPSCEEVREAMLALELPAPVQETRCMTDAFEHAAGLGCSGLDVVWPKDALSVRAEAQRLHQHGVCLASIAREACALAKSGVVVETIADTEARYCVRRKGRDILYYEALLLACIKINNKDKK